MNWKGLGKGVAIIILIILIPLLCHYALTAIPVCGYLELIDADIPKECEKAADDKKKTKVEKPIVPNPGVVAGADDEGSQIHTEDSNFTHTSGGINYFSCEHAIQTSRPDDHDYPSNCPWPLETLSSQTGGDALVHNSKRWIPVQIATAGMTSADAAGKSKILATCCPQREIPTCLGPKIGAGGGYGSTIENCANMPTAWVEAAGETGRVKKGKSSDPAASGIVYHREDLPHVPSSSSTRTVTTEDGQSIPRGLTQSEQNSIMTQCKRGPDKVGEDDWSGDAQRGHHFMDTWVGAPSAWDSSYGGFCTTSYVS